MHCRRLCSYSDREVLDSSPDSGVPSSLNGENGVDLPVDLWEISPKPNLPPARHRTRRERSTPDMCGSVVHVSVSVCTRGEDRTRKRKERSRAVRGPFVRVLLRHSPGGIGETTENYRSEQLAARILLHTAAELDLA